MPAPCHVSTCRARYRAASLRGAIDVSDGLSSDLIHLCQAGGVGCEMHAHALPVGRGVRAFCRARGQEPTAWALHAGEDYALILAVAAKARRRGVPHDSRARVSAPHYRPIHRVRGVYHADRERLPRPRFRPGGWDHLKRVVRHACRRPTDR
jgi:thiamine monophosphate kinase